MLSKKQSAHSPGSHLHLINSYIYIFANSSKLINHGIKPSSQQVTLKYTSTMKYTLRSLSYMWVGLLTDKITNKLEKSNLINEHAPNRESVTLM